jgi:hypothetical protein
MPYWLTNPDHGTMPVYDMGEVERVKKFGWTLLNVGESPIVPKLGKFESDSSAGEVRDEFSLVEAPAPSEQALKEALAESMRLDPPPRRKPGRPPQAQ